MQTDLAVFTQLIRLYTLVWYTVSLYYSVNHDLAVVVVVGYARVLVCARVSDPSAQLLSLTALYYK